MKKLIICAALAISGCGLPGILTAPAPLQQTVIDERGLITAWSAFDVALTAVDGLIATGRIKPGTPPALAIAGYFKTAQSALNAATKAQKAGSTADYFEAMTEARDALRDASAALKGI